MSLHRRLERWRGGPVERDLGGFQEPLRRCNALEPQLLALDDAALKARWAALRAPAPAEAFALVREAARRTLGLRAFDEQVVAGLALHQGRVVEMQTGEGKTLAAVFPAALHALLGRGVHVLTFNDYLARRDAEWMGPVYAFLGLRAAWIAGPSSPDERRAAYAADVTYVTAKEAGFDYLRDLQATDVARLVHRPFHIALVDEADSLLVDEARVPLVIAGALDGGGSQAERMAALVAALTPGLHFDTDEYGRDVELTEAGIEQAEEALGCASLHAPEGYGLLTELNCALHARALLRRDVDYIVRGGRVELVDELTGRVVADRHWPDGLQAALEAKEALARRPDGAILGSVTLQHFLGLYPRVCGMTGTALDAADELHETYGLRTLVVPTHRPVRRVDQPDRLFTLGEAKDDAVVAEVVRVHTSGRPILVGTRSVAESERLAARVRAAGVACAVLNARNDAEEAATIAGAGALGAVTISTNMAGRGTDIRLGGPDETDGQAVRALGGLYVIGTNRHESRRVDLQLRGRAGRQGDPGESRFFISLEDELPLRYGVTDLADIDHAQRVASGQDREIRRTLWRYAAAIEDQRRAVCDRRQALVRGEIRPGLWAGHPRHGELAARLGAARLREAERRVTIARLDRAWREHLAFVADLREGIHLVRLGGDDPLTRFKVAAAEHFRRALEDAETEVLRVLEELDPDAPELGLEGLALKGPSATWTYLVSDDPFRDQLGAQLTGPGRATLAMGAAAMATPLLILLGLVDRFWRKRPERRAP